MFARMLEPLNSKSELAKADSTSHTHRNGKAIASRFATIFILSLSLFAGCGTLPDVGLPAPTNLRVRGTAGVTFLGTIITNGVRSAVSGSVPSDFTIQARDIDCEFLQGPEPGKIDIEISIGTSGSDMILNSTESTRGPYSTVRFKIVNQHSLGTPLPGVRAPVTSITPISAVR